MDYFVFGYKNFLTPNNWLESHNIFKKTVFKKTVFLKRLNLKPDLVLYIKEKEKKIWFNNELGTEKKVTQYLMMLDQC